MFCKCVESVSHTKKSKNKLLIQWSLSASSLFHTRNMLGDSHEKKMPGAGFLFCFWFSKKKKWIFAFSMSLLTVFFLYFEVAVMIFSVEWMCHITPYRQAYNEYALIKKPRWNFIYRKILVFRFFFDGCKKNNQKKTSAMTVWCVAIS